MRYPRRISSLQQARDEASRRGRDSFHRERCSDTPDAAHRNAKQRADADQENEIRRKCRRKLEKGIEHDHDDKGWPPAVPIRGATEYEGPDRPHRQRQNDGEGDARDWRAELCGYRVHHENHQKEVERVEYPGEKTGGHGAALRRSPGTGSGC